VLRQPINCDRRAGPTTIPGKPRKIARGTMTAIDLFAGAGGFSSGAEQAGAEVLWAINHHKEAVACHADNHPYTTHSCTDVFEFDWREAPLSDLIMASPSCKCHSQAATGGIKTSGRRHTAPSHDKLRATPEAAIMSVYRAYHESPGRNRRQPIVVIENVTDFKNWVLYEPIVKISLERMGYAVSEFEINAMDLGVPQDRNRLFVIGVPGKTPFDLRMPKKRKPKGVGSVIRKTGVVWIPLKDYPSSGVVAKAKEQLGRIKTRLKLPKPPEYWLWTNTTTTNPNMPDKPFRTLTAAHGGQTYVMKSRGPKHWIRKITSEELRGIMGFPASYRVPESANLTGKLMGNAVCPAVSKLIVSQLIERA